METLENFRFKIKEIADYAFTHGINSVDIEQIKNVEPEKWGEDIRITFYKACHDGFKIAQKLLVKEIIEYQELLREKTTELKEYRRQRDKDKEQESLTTIKIIEQRLHTLSHIANGIAWQLIGGQIHIARRFYIQDKSTKFLDSSNIEHALHVAEEINQNPNDFALISDLTSFIQIGDLLVLHDKKIGILELKEGKVNDQIAELFEKIEKTGGSVSDEVLEETFDDTTIKQAKRMLRQKERAVRATDVINNDKGIDPATGKNIIVSTPTVYTEYFHEELIKLQENLKEKTWSYTVIDTCLHIGMYRDEGLLMTGLIEKIIKEQTKNYILVDWLTITNNLSEPIFGKPLPHDFIIDILTGKIKVIMGLDLDALINTFNAFGLESRWLTERETMKYKQAFKQHGIVVVNKKGILSKPSGTEVIISGGTLSKIFYDCIKPSSIATSMLSIDYKNEVDE